MRFASIALLLLPLLLTGCTDDKNDVQVPQSTQPSSVYIRSTPQSAYEMLTAETRAMQDDEFANPGFLWVQNGEQLFRDNTRSASCQSCHHEKSNRPLAGAASRYPAYSLRHDRLLNIEARINACRVDHQELPVLNYESEALLSLTAYVSHLANGFPLEVDVSPTTADALEWGQQYFNRRKGQLNLACVHCHDHNVGKRLRGDLISQGHPNGYPAYRLEWQSFGSLHRRLIDCDRGIRAQPYPAGSDEYIRLEYFLNWRAQGLAREAPAVRR